MTNDYCLVYKLPTHSQHNMASGYPYIEVPLDSQRKEIRLLHFADVNQTDTTLPLRCTVAKTTLLPTALEEYHAISYVWGDATRRKDMLIDGFIVDVPESTESALRRLHRHKVLQNRKKRRHLRESEILIWIDAVCINQHDM